jgi:Flp pilus assembly protein TadD
MTGLQLLRRCAVFSAAAAFAVSLSFAQTQGGGSTGGGTTGGGTTGGGTTGGTRGGTTGGTRGETPTQQQDPWGQQSQQQQFPEMRRPLFLQGKVVFEDGTPAPPSVLIERTCSGRRIPEGYTDSKGRFSFEVGRNANLIPDASMGSYSTNPIGSNPWGGSAGGLTNAQGAPGGMSERELTGCDLRAQLPGYRSTKVELTGRRMFDNPDVGTIVLTKIGNVEGLTISMTSLEAPKKAKKAYSNGMKNAKRKKWDKATVEFEKAVAEYPEYAEAWYALGQIYEGTQKADQARNAYGKAMEADGKFMKPYLKLAIMDAQGAQWGPVAEMTGKVIKMNPYDFPEAYFLNSMANLNLNNAQQAEKSAREAIKMKYDRQRPQVEQILGTALAYQNNYEEAAVHLKKYLELSPEAANAPVVRQQLMQLEQFLAQSKPADVPATAAVSEESAQAPQQ